MLISNINIKRAQKAVLSLTSVFRQTTLKRALKLALGCETVTIPKTEPNLAQLR